MTTEQNTPQPAAETNLPATEATQQAAETQLPATETHQPATEATQQATETPLPATGTPTPPPTATPAVTPVKTASPAPSATPSPTPSPAPTGTPVPPDTLVTESGDEYSLDFRKIDSTGYRVGNGAVLKFENGAFKNEFNRLTIKYSSDSPLKVYVKYVQSGKEKSDYFYLEAGSKVVFRGLISSYLSGAAAKNISTITLNVLGGDEAGFTLFDVKTERIDVYDSKLYYLENDRFKIGIQLSWGGGLNYIEDKNCTVSGLGNLVNRHDTGRLIQQSYYGTSGNKEYTPGEFNGSKWVYNPVQGGDKYGNSSRLIDVEVKLNSVYIKSQPQDWSLNGQITPSYMENTYTLTEEFIRVDNRFVDFSGWQHGYSHQELPAFYTVSYLDRFVWYSGADGWTGGELSERKHLNFWGDSRYADECRFFVNEKNTETWCAWVSTADDFGLGLYVPNIDMLYAGRYNYNGTKSPLEDPTNYVAPLVTLRMTSFVPIEYSYLITAGSTEEIRSVFTANKDFADNASLHKNYSSMRVNTTNYALSDDYPSVFSNGAQIANLFNTSANYDNANQALKITVTEAHDPQVMLDYGSGNVRAEDYSAIVIEYMIPNSASRSTYECDLFLCTGSKTTPDGSERTRVTLKRTGKVETVRVELSDLSFWTGKVNRIRFDYFDACTAGDTIYVKSFTLTN